MLLTAVLLVFLLPSEAFFWPQPANAPQAPLFQPPAALTGYAKAPPASNGYDTEPTTTVPPPPPPPAPILPSACLPALPPPKPIEFPALHLNEPYAQPPQPLPTLPPFTMPTLPPFTMPTLPPFTMPTLPPPRPIEFPTLPPPPPPPKIPPPAGYAVAPPVLVQTTQAPPVIDAYPQPKEDSYAQPSSTGIKIPPPPVQIPQTNVHPPAVEQSGY